MRHAAKDPLLTAAKAVIYFIMGVMALVALALLVAAPAVLFLRGEVVAELGAGFPQRFFWLVPVAILAALVLVGLALAFLDQLRRIVATVGAGDPFVSINADRLTRMGWLALAFTLLHLPVAMLRSFLERAADQASSITLEADLNVGALALSLILFILARVFRHGTAMREDLEGTV